MNRRLIYITTFISFLFLHSIVNASPIDIRKDSGLYISVNSGISLPMGNFKSPTSPFGVGGYALNGYGLNMEIEHPVNRGWIGPVFEAGYYINPFNLSAFEKTQAQQIPWSYQATSASLYRETLILLGEFAQIKLKKLTAEFKVMLGLDFVNAPYVYYSQIAPGIAIIRDLPEPYRYTPDPAYLDFVYNFGISLRYPISRRISVCGNSSYLERIKSKLDYPTSYNYASLSQLHVELGMAYYL